MEEENTQNVNAEGPEVAESAPDLASTGTDGNDNEVAGPDDNVTDQQLADSGELAADGPQVNDGLQEEDNQPNEA